MRIISGLVKGRRLRTLKGRYVRPTSDRTRESVFNIIGPVIEGQRVLDLFAGFGAMGIEALSRGAQRASFVEKSRRVAEVIKSNLEELGFSEVEIYEMDVFRFLKQFKMRQEKFDLVLADPPYTMYKEKWITDLWGGVSDLLACDGLFVLEHPTQWIGPQRTVNLTKKSSRKYGQTSVSFYIKAS